MTVSSVTCILMCCTIYFLPVMDLKGLWVQLVMPLLLETTQNGLCHTGSFNVVAPPDAVKPLSAQWQIQTDTRVANISLSLSFLKTRLYFHF